MNWGKGITIVMIAFMGFILSMVVRAFSRDADLIREDYYEHELSFDAEKKATNNFNELDQEVIVQKADKALLIIIPELSAEIENGIIEFYRADEKDWDRSFDLALDENYSQTIPNSEFNKGFYDLTIRWVLDGETFIYKKEINF